MVRFLFHSEDYYNDVQHKTGWVFYIWRFAEIVFVCLNIIYYYRQARAKRSYAGIVFTQ